MEQELAPAREAAKHLHLVKEELDEVNRSHLGLKERVEELEKSRSSLETSLTEKTGLVAALEAGARELREKMLQESESHTQEMDGCLSKQRRLKEQLEEAKKTVATAKTEAGSRREEIKSMKATLSAASQGLEERDDAIKSLKEKLNRAEAEQAKTSDLLKEKVVAMNKIKVGRPSESCPTVTSAPTPESLSCPV